MYPNEFITADSLLIRLLPAKNLKRPSMPSG
jgi:hypothetical protein